MDEWMDLFFVFVLYSAILFFIRNELTALGRAVNFEACCQWARLSVQIVRLVTLPYYSSVCGTLSHGDYGNCAYCGFHYYYNYNYYYY